MRLYEAYADSLTTTMGELIAVTGLKATTASRWVDVIVGKGWAARNRCTLDHRRVFVNLTESGVDAMDRYFRALRG